MTLHIRLAGAQVGRNAYAGFLVTACLLGNRLGASLLFPSGGFLLDKGYSPDGFLKLFSGAAFAMVVVFILIIYNKERVVHSLRRFFPARSNDSDSLVGPFVDRGSKSEQSISKISRPVVVLTTLLNQLGIFLPVFVASFFLDYRATIVQLGFLINSIGTIVTIFYVERILALNAEFSPDDLDKELRKLLSVKASVVCVLGAAAFGGAILIS